MYFSATFSWNLRIQNNVNFRIQKFLQVQRSKNLEILDRERVLI